MKQAENPSYWLPVQHSMNRRNNQNNYHASHKAYMITLKLEEWAQLLGRCSATSRRIELLPLGEAMRTAWLSLPQRFPNVSIIDSPEEYVIMPEHFHGIIYVTGYMQEHLSEVEKLFKARVAMSYRKLLTKLADKGIVDGYPSPSSHPLYSATNPSSNPLYSATNPSSHPLYSATSPSSHPLYSATSRRTGFRAVGTSKQWLEAYCSQPQAVKEATKAWIDRQLTELYSATSRRIQDPPPFKVATSGSHGKQGFLFATGYTDSLLLKPEDIDGHRQYILNNPKSRLQRTANRSMLQVNRMPIDTAVTIPALFKYLRSECHPLDVTPEKLEAVHSFLMCSATSRRIECLSYGDRTLLQRRLLPIVCHRRNARLFEKQKARCLEEAAKGTVMVSAAISQAERNIFLAVQAAGYPVVKIEDNGFPEIYHPSQERIDLCNSGQLLIVTPWQYHYKHKEDSIFVAYCKTMNCIAQALSRKKDTWWMEP